MKGRLLESVCVCCFHFQKILRLGLFQVPDRLHVEKMEPRLADVQLAKQQKTKNINTAPSPKNKKGSV